MFETGFFSLFGGLGFLGGAISALLLIGLCIFTLIALVVTTVQHPILFVMVTAVYWFCAIKYTHVPFGIGLVYGIYFILWLAFTCVNDEEFKRDKLKFLTSLCLTIISAVPFVGYMFLID